MDNKIDIVIPWVDGGDVEWQKERNKYAGKGPDDYAEYRYRDMGLLKYLFRGIEKNMPWVNKVYFVTNGQKPDWLNLDCDKLVWIKHEDYIPKEYLPTFSANPIELNFHRIKDLSENFIYFNDDTYPVLPLDEDFFIKDDLPRYAAGADTAKADGTYFQQLLFNDMKLICKGYKKNNVIKENLSKFYSFNLRFETKFKTFCLSPFKTFSIFHVYHMPNLIKKSDMEQIWEKHNDKLSEVSSNRFRCEQDVNQYIFSWNRILTGKFLPAYEKKTKFYNLDDYSAETIINDINKKKYKLVCINDVCSNDSNIDFESNMNKLIKKFEELFPKKCSFEK